MGLSSRTASSKIPPDVSPPTGPRGGRPASAFASAASPGTTGAVPSARPGASWQPERAVRKFALMNLVSRLVEHMLDLPSPLTRGVLVGRDLAVPTRDGVTLLADRWYPRNAPANLPERIDIVGPMQADHVHSTVAGHKKPGLPDDASALRYTRSYLLRFEEAVAASRDARARCKDSCGLPEHDRRSRRLPARNLSEGRNGRGAALAGIARARTAPTRVSRYRTPGSVGAFRSLVSAAPLDRQISARTESAANSLAAPARR